MRINFPLGASAPLGDTRDSNRAVRFFDPAVLRSWIGTPFHHGASLKGVGCDCYGLIVGVARDMGLRPPALPVYPHDPKALTDMERAAVKEHFLSFARLIPREETRDGDILIFSLSQDPVHFAFRLTAETFLHADRHQGVMETRYTPSWQRRHRMTARKGRR